MKREIMVQGFRPDGHGGLEVLSGDNVSFEIYASTYDGNYMEITEVRDVPVIIEQLDFADPFGPQSALLRFHGISIMEKVTLDEFPWWFEGAEIDIIAKGAYGNTYDWIWEGHLVSEEIDELTRAWSVKGALMQADDFLQKPVLRKRPVPMEYEIARVFDSTLHPTLKTKPLKIEWPDDFDIIFQPETFQDWRDNYLTIDKLELGQKWSGFATRDVASWQYGIEYSQSLLENMITPNGDKWTIKHSSDRQPVLAVRPTQLKDISTTYTLYAGVPGVALGTFSRDYTQVENVIYGEGVGTDGQVFTGLKMNADLTMDYDPFASATSTLRRESRISFQQGMSHAMAKKAAEHRLEIMKDPGYVGSFTLTSDPFKDGVPFSRFLIQAGETVLVSGLLGQDIKFHITNVSVSMTDLSVTITVDSLCRDAVTVDEVKARTKDPLDPVRLLALGQFQPQVPDPILTWNLFDYAGCIPMQGWDVIKESKEGFPWKDATQKLPPKDYPDSYVKLNNGPEKNDNWTGSSDDKPIPVYVGQAGSINLTQLAIYNADGEVVPATFHLSFYDREDITTDDMPMIPGTDDHYPFFENAFEKVQLHGAEFEDPSDYDNAPGVNRLAGWGNGYARAGYYPELSTNTEHPPTGLLSSSDSWSYDSTKLPDWEGFDEDPDYTTDAKTARERMEALAKGLDPYTGEELTELTVGYVYAMIYQEDIADCYALGRIYQSTS